MICQGETESGRRIPRRAGRRLDESGERENRQNCKRLFLKPGISQTGRCIRYSELGIRLQSSGSLVLQRRCRGWRPRR